MRIFGYLTFILFTHSFLAFGQNHDMNMNTVRQDCMTSGLNYDCAKQDVVLSNMNLNDLLPSPDWQNTIKHKTVTGKKRHCAATTTGVVIGAVSFVALLSVLIMDTTIYSHSTFRQQCLLNDALVGSLAGIGLGCGLMHLGGKFEDKYPVRFGFFVKRRQIGIACDF